VKRFKILLHRFPAPAISIEDNRKQKLSASFPEINDNLKVSKGQAQLFFLLLVFPPAVLKKDDPHGGVFSSLRKSLEER
jgi:hypothetical protein